MYLLYMYGPHFRLSSEYIGHKLLYLAYKKTGFLCDSRFSMELFLLIIHDLSLRCKENFQEDIILFLMRLLSKHICPF